MIINFFSGMRMKKSIWINMISQNKIVDFDAFLGKIFEKISQKRQK